MGFAQFQYFDFLLIVYDVDDTGFGHSCSSSSNDCANSINDGCLMPNDCDTAVRSDRASVGVSISCFEGERSGGDYGVVTWACWVADFGLETTSLPRKEAIAMLVATAAAPKHKALLQVRCQRSSQRLVRSCRIKLELMIR